MDSFNQVVIGALDEVYGALESERFLAGDVKGTQEALGIYTKQVRRIRSAASSANMRGLHFACAQIERNVLHFTQQQRLLSSNEASLLSDVPELLAQYALNQSCCKIDDLMRHLLDPSWPLALRDEQASQLRQLLNTDPSGAQEECEQCVTRTCASQIHHQ